MPVTHRNVLNEAEKLLALLDIDPRGSVGQDGKQAKALLHIEVQ